MKAMLCSTGKIADETPFLRVVSSVVLLILLSVNAFAQPIVDFSADRTSVCVSEVVTFSDLSTGIVGSATYSWSFGENATPSNATGAGPHLVTYSAAGTNTVTLTVTDEVGASTESKNNYITVNPVNSVLLTSNPGSNNQSVCLNSPISAISYTTFGASGATFSGLPSGVTGTWTEGLALISGIPSVTGNFSYTITLTGGCGDITESGGIIVNSLPATPIVTVSDRCDGTSILTTSSPGLLAWNTGETTSSITVTSAGTYSVITTLNGCSSIPGVASASPKNAPPNPEVSVDCSMGLGEALVIVTNPVGGNYLYNLNVDPSGSGQPQPSNPTPRSTFQPDPFFIGVANGEYSVAVRNSDGCTSTSTLFQVVCGSTDVPTLTLGSNTGNACGTNSFAVSNNTFGGSATQVTISTNGDGIVFPGSTSMSPFTFTYTPSPDDFGKTITITLTTNNPLGPPFEAASATFSLSIYPLPVADAGSPISIPHGTSTTLSATVTGDGPFNYSWSPALLLIDATVENPTTINLSETTVFTLTATSQVSGCSSSSMVTITVTGSALSVGTSATPPVICIGANTTLEALASGGSGSYSYSWSSTPSGFSSTEPTVIVSPTETTIYEVTVDDGYNLVTSQVLVRVNDLPPAPVVNVVNNCDGTTELSTTAEGNLLWSTGAITASISVTTAGTYTVTTTVDGCTSPAGSGVAAPGTTPSSITTTLTQATCAVPTGTIVITGPLGAGLEYSIDGTTWSTTTTYSGLASGDYTVRARYASDPTCESTMSVTLTAAPDIPSDPVIEVNCSLGSSNAIVSVTSPLGDEYEYRLNDGDYQSFPVFANVINGTYTITVRNTDGCETISNSFVVSCDCVNGPTLTLSSTTGSTCGTSPITVSGNVFGGNATSVTITTNGTGIIVPTSTSSSPFAFAYTPAAGDIGNTVTITITTNNPLGEPCVAATSTYTLTVNTIPVITGSTPASRCGSGSVTLGATASGGTINWYAEATGGEPLGSGTSFATPVISSTTTYYVDATENGCTSAVRIPVVATIDILPSAITGADRAIMLGQNTLIGASAVPGNTFLWSSYPVGFVSEEANPTVMPAVTTQYTLVETNGTTGCTNSNDVTVTVYPLPLAFIPVWWPESEMEQMHIQVQTATLDGIDLTPGDAVGVFDGSICVGTGVITEALTGSNYLFINLSMDDPDTPEIDGFVAGRPIIFRIWDASTDTQTSYVDAVYVTGTGIFSEGATAVVNLTAFNRISQSINLQSGWNILSFAAEPDNMSMLAIVNPLIQEGSLIKVQDESGNAIEQLPFPIGWINNIGQMRTTEGYKIRVRNNTQLSISGRPAGSSISIPLTAGWNIIGYPFITAQSAMSAFEQLISQGSLLKVQDEGGNAIEQLPFPIGWVDRIHELEPGEGYKVRTSINTTLTLSNLTGSGKKGNVSINQPSHFKPDYLGNGLDHMNLYIMNPTMNGSALKNGDEIGVFDGNICVGAVVIENPFEEYIAVNVSVDDPTTLTKDGFTEGNRFELRAWSNLRQQEMISRDLTIAKGYTDKFIKGGTSLMNADFTLLPEVYLSDAFPNPSNYKTTFTFSLGRETKVRLEVINSTGKVVEVLVNGELSEGTHSIEWYNKTSEGSKVLPGIYHYRLTTDSYTRSKTLIIQ